MKDFTAIWNEAYEAYHGQGIDGLNSYLESSGLSEADAEMLKDDIIETYYL